MADPSADLLDEYIELARRGEAIEVEAFLALHPELEDGSRRTLRTLLSVFGAGDSAVPTFRSLLDQGHGAVLELASPPPRARGARGATGADAPRTLDESFGPYRLLSEIGRGGQGVVYLAQDTRLARRVALKILNGALPRSDPDAPISGAAARMRREAEVASKLDHPGICVVHEVGEHDGRPFIAMRFVEGETLARRIARGRDRGLSLVEITTASGAAPDAGTSAAPAGAVDGDSTGGGRRRALLRVVELVERAARALHVAHEAGVIHRDVKPGNIMVTPGGWPVLLDFGMARDQHSDAAALTITGEMFGSPAYMSPEQIGPHGKSIDRSTDVYSLGVVLYECLTLRRPFDHPTRDGIYRAILLDEPLPARKLNPDVPSDLEVVIATALEKDRPRRYRTALDLAEDLRRVRAIEPIRARPAGVLLRARRWAQRNPALATTALALFALMGAALWIQARQARLELAHARSLLGSNLIANSTVALGTDPSLALLLAIEGATRQPGKLAQDELYQALSRMRELRVVQADPRGLVDARFAPDGATCVTVSKDGRLRAWRTADWTVAADLEVPPGSVQLVFSADGTRLAVSTQDKRVRVLDARTFAWERELPPHASWIGKLALSPDGSRLLACCDSCATLTDVATGAEKRFDQTSGVTGVAAFSADGARALVGIGGRVHVVDASSGETLPLEGTASDRCGRFSPDGKRVLAHLVDGNAGVFDPATGKRVQLLAWPQRVECAEFTPDGKFMLTTHTNGRVNVWAPRIKLPVAACDDHKSPPSSVVFDPKSRLALTAGADRSARVWRLRDGGFHSVCLGHTDLLYQAVFDPRDPDRILTASRDGTLRVWDAQSYTQRHTLDPVGGSLRFASLSPDGSLVAACGDRSLCVVDVATRKKLFTRADFPDALHSVEWSPDGKTVVVSCHAGDASVWDARSGELVARIPEHPFHVWYASISPDGTRVVTACEDGRARVFDLKTLALVHVLEGHAEGVRCARYSPDGRRILTTSENAKDRSIRVWDAATGAAGPILRVPDPREPRLGRPIFASFSPDGNRIAAGYWDGVARVWDVGAMTHEERSEPSLELRDVDIVSEAAFSPDGKRIVTGSRSRRLRVWSAVDGAPIADLPPDRSEPACVAFSRDGQWILAGCADGSVHLWPADPLQAARSRAPRALSEEEKRRCELDLDPDFEPGR